MRREHALRYLLLRHIKAIEQEVPASAFAEVTRTLAVTKEADSYLVEWRVAGAPQRKRFSETDFSFYRRGDTDAASRSVDEDLRTDNDATAKQFVAGIFGLRPAPADVRASTHETAGASAFAQHVLAVVGVAIAAPLGAAPAALLVALGGVEFLKHGRLYAAVGFVVIASVAPGAAITGAAAYATLQFLDPDPRQRTLRAGIAVVAVAVGVVQKAVQGSDISVTFVGLVAGAFFVAAARSLVYSHRQALPLAMPFVWAGFALDGSATVAFSGCGFAALGVVYLFVTSRRGRRQLPPTRRRVVAEPAATPVTFHVR